jgi:hypothetical protein
VESGKETGRGNTKVLSKNDNDLPPEPKHDTRKEIAKAAGVSTGKVAQAERHRHPRGRGQEVCYTLCYFEPFSGLPLKTRRFPLKPAWILASKAIDATQRNAENRARTQS